MQAEGGMPPRTVQSGAGQEPRKRQRQTLAVSVGVTCAPAVVIVWRQAALGACGCEPRK